MQDQQGHLQYAQRICAHPGAVTAIAQSPAASTQFASACEHGTLVLSQLGADGARASSAVVATGFQQPITCCTFDVAGSWIVAATAHGELLYHSLLDQQVAKRVALPGPPKVRPSCGVITHMRRCD